MRHAALVLFVFACSSSNEATPTDEREVDGECSAAVTRVEAAMEGDLSGTYLPNTEPDFEVPERASGTVEIGLAPSILLTDTLLLLDGRRVDADSILGDLGTLGRNWQILHPDEGEWDRRINVLADARVARRRSRAASHRRGLLVRSSRRSRQRGRTTMPE